MKKSAEFFRKRIEAREPIFASLHDIDGRELDTPRLLVIDHLSVEEFGAIAVCQQIMFAPWGRPRELSDGNAHLLGFSINETQCPFGYFDIEPSNIMPHALTVIVKGILLS
jgi:hypothetical protein